VGLGGGCHPAKPTRPTEEAAKSISSKCRFGVGLTALDGADVSATPADPVSSAGKRAAQAKVNHEKAGKVDAKTAKSENAAPTK